MRWSSKLSAKTPTDPGQASRIVSRAPLIAIALALCAALPGAALSATTATMSATFTPDRLGAATTLSFNFQTVTGTGAPALLTGVDFHYPANLGIATSGLGVASCPAGAIEAHGPSVCPPDSRMGSGSALVEIPIGSDVVQETAQVALLAGPSQNGYVQILASVTGESPVAARVVLSTQLQPGLLQIPVPPIPSLPEAPYVAVVRMHLTLGGNITYYEPVNGKNVAYRPAGIGIPRSCPRGGFRFSADFSFLDGAHAQARTTVACPRGR
jgi:hypothetical protein